MTPISVVGDRHTVLAFGLGGVPGTVVETAAEARMAIAAAAAPARDGHRGQRAVLVLVTRGAADLIREDLDRLMLDPGGPLVVEVPGFGEPSGKRPVADFVERVLGISL